MEFEKYTNYRSKEIQKFWNYVGMHANLHKFVCIHIDACTCAETGELEAY